MASQFFLASDLKTGADSLNDLFDLPAVSGDDFAVHSAASIQADTTGVSNESGPKGHLASLDSESVLPSGHHADAPNSGVIDLASVAANVTQPPTNGFDNSDIGLASLVQSALENGAGLSCLDSYGLAQGGPEGGACRTRG